MAVQVSNDFKNMCKTNVPSGAIGSITILEEDPEYNVEITESTDIQSIEIEDNCYVNDKFIGTTVAKKITVNLFNDDNIYDLENKEIEVRLGFDINNETEIVDYGNFIIEKPDTEEVQAKTNFVGYDYMIKFNKDFIDNNTYPVALGTYFSNLCSQVGLIAGNTTFVNSDYMVTGNPFTNGEKCRKVLSDIAQIAGGIAKIGRDNKVYIINLSKTTNLEEIDGNNYDTFSPNKVFGPINKLIIKMNSNVDGEESVRSDTDSIAQNGECAITISDNSILNSEEQRELVIDNIFNAIKGITYLPFKTTYYGYPYIDSTDKINILNVDDTEYDSYVFNHTIKYDGAFEGSIETSALTKTQSAYKDTSNLKSKFKKTELMVDKINGQITSIIERQDGTQTQINTITQDITSTTNKISQVESDTNAKIEELSTSIEGVTNKFTENGGNNLFYYAKEFWVGGDVERTTTRSIQVGDDLSGKKLIFNFPVGVSLGDRTAALEGYNVIEGNTGYSIFAIEETDLTTYDSMDDIFVKQNGTQTRIYRYDRDESQIINNYTELTLSDNFGQVVAIDTNSPLYQYIKIQETVIDQVLNIEEYSNTEIKNNSVSGRGYIVNNGSSFQDTSITNMAVPNGTYTVSFKYKKIGPVLANASVKINDIEYVLEETNWTVFSQTIEVTTNHIKIEFIADTDNTLYVVDLLGNLGESADVWTQNPNETRTDTVKIGKGIEVRSSTTDTMLKADSDGVRVVQASNESNVVAEFTDKGTKTKELIVTGQAQISGILIQQVGNQTWISSLL